MNWLTPQRGQFRSSPAVRLAASTGAASALSLAGLPMHAVPLDAARLSRSVGPAPSAGAATVRPRRHPRHPPRVTALAANPFVFGGNPRHPHAAILTHRTVSGPDALSRRV